MHSGLYYHPLPWEHRGDCYIFVPPCKGGTVVASIRVSLLVLLGSRSS